MFRYLRKILNFNHCKQINLMLLNNIAQKRYLLGEINYSNLIPYSIKKLKKLKMIINLNL